MNFMYSNRSLFWRKAGIADTLRLCTTYGSRWIWNSNREFHSIVSNYLIIICYLKIHKAYLKHLRFFMQQSALICTYVQKGKFRKFLDLEFVEAIRKTTLVYDT